MADMSIDDLRKAAYDRYARFTDWRTVDPSLAAPMEPQDVLDLIDRERMARKRGGDG